MEHWQHIINVIGGAMLAAVGWFCREIWDSVQELKRDVHKLEVSIPEGYIKRVEIESRLDKIDARFEKLDAHITKLFERLDNK
jgi:hypothetical protein